MNHPHFCLEHWIPGYEGKYSIDTTGNVRSYKRRPAFLKPQLRNDGYQVVKLNGKQKTVHSLVMHAFYGERPKGKLVLHDDDNKLNNDIINLRYGTHHDNLIDAHRNKRRTHNGRHKGA